LLIKTAKYPTAKKMNRTRDCNLCRHVLMKGEFITCGLVMSEQEEGDVDLADGIGSDFAEVCEEFLPNEPE
jgi:hypothetical protein